MKHIDFFGFFVTLCKHQSLAATARELDITPSAATKRLASMEDSLGVKLVNRTTRKLSLTTEGELYLERANRILGEIADLELQLSTRKEKPTGMLRVNAPLGFGRSYIAPILSEFRKLYPDVNIQLTLTDTPMQLPDEAVDVVIRLGTPPDSRIIARKIATNRRLLCAAPAYIKRHGEPRQPQDLANHTAIVLRQNNETANLWHFERGNQSETVRVSPYLSTNDGSVAVRWALEGHGILVRAEWDIARYLRNGQLVRLLEEYGTPPGDVYAVYLQKSTQAARVSLFLDYLSETFLGNDPEGDIW